MSRVEIKNRNKNNTPIEFIQLNFYVFHIHLGPEKIFNFADNTLVKILFSLKMMFAFFKFSI